MATAYSLWETTVPWIEQWVSVRYFISNLLMPITAQESKELFEYVMNEIEQL